jgi:hypothetical protein
MQVLFRSLRARPFELALATLMGGLAVLYLVYTEKFVPPWDPSSMVILAQSLVQHGRLQFLDVNNVLVGPYFNPHGFDIRAPFDPAPYSMFPPGFSFMLAPLYVLTNGLGWLYVIPPILSIASLGAAAYIGYTLSDKWGSILAVLLIGTSHVFMTFATSLWSDGPSLALLLMGIALYIAAARSNRLTFAVCSGLALGGFILFKFVNVVFAVLIPAHHMVIGQNNRRWPIAGTIGLGVLLGSVGMLAYNASAYGSPLANAYQPWGQRLYDFPLYSLRYLFFKSPFPWNDWSSNAIVSGMFRDMSIGSVLFLMGMVIDRRNPSRLLLALVAVTNVLLYALSVFTPRQFVNMRYMLPALAAAYLLAADVLARVMARFLGREARVFVFGIVFVICAGRVWWNCLPDLAVRNEGTANAVRATIATARELPSGSVVLAYNLADTFILYGNLSVLNYRRVESPDVNTRNQVVAQAIVRLLCADKPVYLVQDDQLLFNSLYPYLDHRFVLLPMATPLKSYRIALSPAQRCQGSSVN